MDKFKNKNIILIIIGLVIVIGITVWVIIGTNKSYLSELSYEQVMEKVNNKEDFVLLLSQTTCSHCKDYKPKLARVAKNYKLKVFYLEVNLLKNENIKELKRHFNYDSTPTTIFVINGEEKTAANRISGDVSETKIINKLKSNGFIE